MTSLEELPGRFDDLAWQVSQLRVEMRGEFSVIRGEFSAIRSEVADQVGGLSTQMPVLHEDVVARIALLHEGLSGGANRRPKKK